MQAFVPAVVNAIKASQSWADQLILYAYDLLTGTVSDLSYVLYADTLAGSVLLHGPNAILMLRAWDTTLDQHIHLIGVWQNLGKRQ
eukprot:8092801-Heterocapsa_arctica.AAC.1